jgi:hypothetical protein
MNDQGADGNWLINSMWSGQNIHVLNQINFSPSTQDFPSSASITSNRWYKITAHAVMNTVGQSNGIIQVWLDDVLIINASTVKYRDANVGWKFFEFSPTYGGGSPPTVPSTCYLWVDSTIISTDPIGANPTPKTTGIPSAPFKLNIN